MSDTKLNRVGRTDALLLFRILGGRAALFSCTGEDAARCGFPLRQALQTEAAQLRHLIGKWALGFARGLCCVSWGGIWSYSFQFEDITSHVGGCSDVRKKESLRFWPRSRWRRNELETDQSRNADPQPENSGKEAGGELLGVGLADDFTESDTESKSNKSTS